MPTYEYICSKCDGRFEISQRIIDKPLTVCPKDSCQRKTWGKGKVKRAIGTGGGLIFKGSGFYINDYRSDKYKEAAKKDAPPSPSPDKGKTDVAPKTEKKAPKAASAES